MFLYIIIWKHIKVAYARLNGLLENLEGDDLGQHWSTIWWWSDSLGTFFISTVVKYNKFVNKFKNLRNSQKPRSKSSAFAMIPYGSRTTYQVTSQGQKEKFLNARQLHEVKTYIKIASWVTKILVITED